jgi:hypothetical protein
MSSVNERRKAKAFEKVIRRRFGNNIPSFFKFKVHSSFQDTYNSIVLPTNSGVTLPTKAELETDYNEEVTKEETRPFQTIDGDFQVGTSNLYVDVSTSRVGIGTAEPEYSLDVVGDLNFTGDLYQGGSPFAGSPWTTLNSNIYYSSGNVGIGTAEPEYSLDIVGDINFTGAVKRQGNPVPMTQWTTLNGNIYYSSGNVGIGTDIPGYTLDVNGTVYASGDVIMFSDERKKTNIKPITNALDKVLQLRGVTFDKIGDGTRRHAGIIAQEIEKVLPEVVYTDDDGMKGVAYGNIIALLIEAIKELKKS